MLAEDYLRMYITKVQKMEPSGAFSAGRGHRQDRPGGGWRHHRHDGGAWGRPRPGTRSGWSKRPTSWAAGWPNSTNRFRRNPLIVSWRIRVSMRSSPRSRSNPRIKVYHSAATSEIDGAPGLFDVTLKSTGNGKPEGEVLDTFRVGAIIQATGWRPNGSARDLALRQGRRCGSERRSGGDGQGAGPHHPPLRRQGSEEHRVHPMWRLQRQRAPLLLLVDMLPDLAQAGPVPARER